MPTKSSFSRLFSRSVATTLLHACTFAAAQSVVPPPAATLNNSAPNRQVLFDSRNAYPDIWPDSRTISPGQNLLVVSTAKPRIRQKCRVQSLDSDLLVCARRLGRNPVRFDRSSVSALIAPGYRPQVWLYDAVGAALAGGSIYGAVVLTSISALAAVGGIAMAVVITFDALWILGEANAEFGPDHVLYLKPGEQLLVPLEVGP
jgi:hypothetical protein